VLVDRPLYAVVGGDGACCKTGGRGDRVRPLDRIALTAVDGAVTVASLTVYELKSAWQDR